MARYLVDGQVSIDMSLEYLIKWAINEAAIYNVYGTTNMLIRYFNSWLRCGVMYIIFAHTFLEQNLMLILYCTIILVLNVLTRLIN